MGARPYLSLEGDGRAAEASPSATRSMPHCRHGGLWIQRNMARVQRDLVPFSVLGKAPSTVRDENEGTLLTSTADSCILSW